LGWNSICEKVRFLFPQILPFWMPDEGKALVSVRCRKIKNRIAFGNAAAER